MQAPRNTFKRRLLAGDTQNGLWLSLGSPISSEALSLVGFDWLLFDTEHPPIDLASVQPLLQAAAVGTAQAVVRPAWNDKVLIKRVLDMGAQTLLVPFVETPEEAAAAVAATRYPPKGLRGVAGATRASRYGLTSDYFAVSDDEIAVLVQIETTNALTRLEEIAAVPGVDGVFIGPSDSPPPWVFSVAPERRRSRPCLKMRHAASSPPARPRASSPPTRPTPSATGIGATASLPVRSISASW